MDKDLLKIIQEVGFTEKESRVYLALLELAKGTASQIAKLTELKRPIIYVVLESLEKRGYVTQLPNKKINEYQAIDPSVILNKAKTSIKNFSDFLPLLQTLHNKGERRPKINYIETKEGIWNAWNEFNYTKNVFFITSYERISKHFPSAIAKWMKELKRGAYKLQGRHLVSSSPEELKFGKELVKSKQQVKFIDEFKNINMDFALWENKLAITSLEDKPFMVIIESQELADSMKLIFDIAWSRAKEI